MSFIAAIMILVHDNEEDAFYNFVAMIENILPSNYFTSHLLGVQADQKVLNDFLLEYVPKIMDHFHQTHDVNFEVATFSWFLTCYVDIVPTEVKFIISLIK